MAAMGPGGLLHAFGSVYQALFSQSAPAYQASGRKYDTYITYCYLSGKVPSLKEYSLTDFDTLESRFPYPAEVLAAYHRIKVAEPNSRRNWHKMEKACDHFDQACKKHGLDAGGNILDALQKMRARNTASQSA